MRKLLIGGVAAMAAIIFAPVAHAMPAGDICNSAKCDQMFLSRIDSSNFHPANGGGDQQWIPLAKQVCGVFQAQWGQVTSPQIFQTP
jgi:hypothetical protein